MDLSLTLRKWPGLFERLGKIITAERAAAWFSKIADTYAPSQTARYTRGPVLRDLLQAAGDIEGLSFHQNLWKTGNVAIALGRQPGKPLWMLAHLDGISYALGFREGDRPRAWWATNPGSGRDCDRGRRQRHFLRDADR